MVEALDFGRPQMRNNYYCEMPILLDDAIAELARAFEYTSYGRTFFLEGRKKADEYDPIMESMRYADDQI